MRKSFFKFSVLSVLPVMLFCGFPDISSGQQVDSPANQSTEADNGYASQKPLKEDNQKNPGTLKTKTRFLLNTVKANQWSIARKHYDAIISEIASKDYFKANDKDFERMVGVKRSDLTNLENRFRLIGKEKFKKFDSQTIKDEKLSYHKLYEAFILNPAAAETRKDLLKRLISFYEDKIGVVFADGDFKLDQFIWNQELMLELLHLYYLDGQYEKSAMACMRALDYVQSNLEEGYITNIFDKCNSKHSSDKNNLK